MPHNTREGVSPRRGSGGQRRRVPGLTPRAIFGRRFAARWPANIDDGTHTGFSDGVVSCTDVVDASAFTGATLGSAGYVIQLDLDLDGDNDAADYALYLANHPTADLDDGSGTGTPDGGVDINDLTYFMTAYLGGAPGADIDDGTHTGFPDGGVDINDFLYFLELYEGGC